MGSVKEGVMNKSLFFILLMAGLACNRLVSPTNFVPPTEIPDSTFCQSGRSINEDANGQTFRVHIGDLLRIELDQNASTGYEWLVKEIEAEVLKNLGTEYSYGSNLPPGSGGKQLLCFVAIGSGATILRLIYRQPWDMKTTPVPYSPPDFEIKIEIDK
jgi:predicted secreted protein